MLHAFIIDLSFCSAVCQKWNISIKRCDQTAEGWCTVARAIRNEIPHLVLCLRAQQSSLPHLIALYVSPLTGCLLGDCLISFYLQFALSFPCLHYISPPFCQICSTSPFLLALSLSHSSSLINISLTFCDNSFLSVSSLYLCLCVARQAYRRALLSISSLLSPRRTAVMGPNALLISVTSQNIPADAHMGTFAHSHAPIDTVEANAAVCS